MALVGFGTFLVRERAARAGRNPKTGEAIQIAAAMSLPLGRQSIEGCFELISVGHSGPGSLSKGAVFAPFFWGLCKRCCLG